MDTTVVVGGGPVEPDDVARALAGLSPALVVAADSGLEACAAAGVHCDLVVGDLDSVAPATLGAARRRGTVVQRHPLDKDTTDLDLALQVACRADAATPHARRVLVVATAGGRVDHLLSLAALVGSPRWRDHEVEAVLEGTRVLPVHGHRHVDAAPGTTVSLLPLHGTARGVTAYGFRWELEDAVLEPDRTLGVSNVVVDRRAVVSVTDGVVTVVVPAPEATGTGPVSPETNR